MEGNGEYQPTCRIIYIPVHRLVGCRKAQESPSHRTPTQSGVLGHRFVSRSLVEQYAHSMSSEHPCTHTCARAVNMTIKFKLLGLKRGFRQDEV